MFFALQGRVLLGIGILLATQNLFANVQRYTVIPVSQAHVPDVTLIGFRSDVGSCIITVCVASNLHCQSAVRPVSRSTAGPHVNATRQIAIGHSGTLSLRIKSKNHWKLNA